MQMNRLIIPPVPEDAKKPHCCWPVPQGVINKWRLLIFWDLRSPPLLQSQILNLPSRDEISANLSSVQTSYIHAPQSDRVTYLRGDTKKCGRDFQLAASKVDIITF